MRGDTAILGHLTTQSATATAFSCIRTYAATTYLPMHATSLASSKMRFRLMRNPALCRACATHAMTVLSSN